MRPPLRPANPMAVYCSPYLHVDREIQIQQYTQPVETGHTWLFLKMKPPADKELRSEAAYVTGQLVIYEEQASLAATILPVQGVFLRKTGKLTLFGNSPDSSVQLLFRRKRSAEDATVDAANTTTTEADEELAEEQTVSPMFEPRLDSMNLGVIEGVPLVEHKEDYEAVDISPPRYAYVSRFRSSDTFSDQCLSILEMSLVNKTEGDQEANHYDDEDEEAWMHALKNMKLTGSLSSVNCGLYLRVEATFQEENLNEFFAKASHYAVIMTFVVMGEIYFLLRQLQISSTQATAAKVSLLTIGQQAIVDSYLCLGHLTIGIVAQVCTLDACIHCVADD